MENLQLEIRNAEEKSRSNLSVIFILNENKRLSLSLVFEIIGIKQSGRIV